MGEALMMRRFGARITEGKHAWRKSGNTLVKKTVNYTGTYTWEKTTTEAAKFYMPITSAADARYFTEETFWNSELTGAVNGKLLPNGVCEYSDSQHTNPQTYSGEWSYNAEKNELYMNCRWAMLSQGEVVNLEGSGEAYQPEFGFIGYVVSNDSAKYPDNGTQGEYTYEKISEA